MGRIFSITSDEFVFDVLTQHILSTYSEEEISELKIILPCKRDVIALLNAFQPEKCMILPEITSLENIDEEEAILNLDIVPPEQQLLLLIEFILKWNEQNNDNYPIDLAYSILSLLNTTAHLKKIESFMKLLIADWSDTLRKLGMIDKLEHRKRYINNIILSLHNAQRIIFVGIEKEEIYLPLIKAIYDLPHGTIILPNVNFHVPEKNWKSLDVKHYQCIIKNVLDAINVSRDKITHLGKQSDKIIDYIFDTTIQFNIEKEMNNNLNIITCNSVEEEAELILSIIQNEDYDNVSLFINDQLLAIRIACSLKQYNIKNYFDITLLLYSIELLTSNWNSIALLSLLKHPLVEFGYAKERYYEILTELEIKILRNFNANSFKEIIDTMNKHKNIKYKEDILTILNHLQTILDPLLHAANHSIYEIVKAHLQCFPQLSTITNFANACKNTTIKCSLELYSKILNLFFQKHFFSFTENLLIENKLSLHKTKVVILTDLNCLREEYNYFLYNLFYANRLYIIRLANQRKSILLKRIEIFCKGRTYNRRNIVTNIISCTQPAPKPNIQVRKEKMEVISCSALEKLMRNPYTFYVEYILNIRKLKDLNAKPTILEFSIIARRIFSKHPLNLPLDELPPNFSSIWCIKLQKIIQSFIQINKTRGQYIDTEKNFSFPISKEILLTVKCDRVEYLTDNSIAITNYKLGSQIPRFFPQLILQALAVEFTTKKKVSELAYWKFDYDQVKIISAQNYTEKMQEFQNTLPQLLSNYLNNADIPFTASPYLDKFLRLNDYTHLERIKEWL